MGIQRMKLESHGTNVTSDAGLLTCRQSGDVAALTSFLPEEVFDFRTGSCTSTTTEAWRDSGSKRASIPCSGPSYRATTSKTSKRVPESLRGSPCTRDRRIGPLRCLSGG
jgi:hypothetical protein